LTFAPAQTQPWWGRARTCTTNEEGVGAKLYKSDCILHHCALGVKKMFLQEAVKLQIILNLYLEYMTF
jgi:hypothetical protein